MTRNCYSKDMKQLDAYRVAGANLDTYRNPILAR